MSSDAPFTRENLDFIFKELARELKKLGGKKIDAEIILIGGASILANYCFRETTYDMDAIISAPSFIKDAINRVGDRYGLPHGWLNCDFMRTRSFTPKLVEFSVHYKTFSGILAVRTVAAEYLIAMKLMAGRIYKNDLADIVGILNEHYLTGRKLTFEQIDKAVCNLYGSWNKISSQSRNFIVSVLDQTDYEQLYAQYKEYESYSRDILLEYQQEKPDRLDEDTINAILEKAKRKKHSKEEAEK